MELYVFKAKCTNVVDGDTIDAEIDLGFDIFAKQRLRFNRIDTPETNEDGFQKAKDFVKDKLEDQDFYCQAHKTGNFGRWLSEIYLKDDDETNLNDLLLDKDFAEKYESQ